MATNTPALPFLPDAVYNALFPQAARRPERARRSGRARVHDTGVVVDISHMREDAIEETFKLSTGSTGRLPLR